MEVKEKLNQTQRERKKNLSRMQKLGQEKSSDFMKNLGSQVNELNAFSLSPRFDIKLQESKSNEFMRENSEEQKSEGELRYEQRHSISGSNREEDDSELLRCRQQLQEIQRQQMEKQLYQLLGCDQYLQELEMQGLYGNNQSYLMNQSQIYYKDQFNQQILLNEPNEHDLIAEERWDEQDDQRQKYDIKTEYKQKSDRNISEQLLRKDFPLTNLTLNAEQQIYSSFENNHEEKIYLEKDYSYVATNGQKILCQGNNHEEKISSNLTPKKPDVTSPNVLTTLKQIHSLNHAQEPSKNVQKKSKVVQQLRQELVHKITDDLEAIFDLFKQKMPQMDEIQIIKALYLKYIGPQEQVKQKKAVNIKKNQKIINDKNPQINGHVQQNSINNSNPKSNSKIQVQKQQTKLNPSNEIENYKDEGYPDPRSIIPHLNIPKVEYPKIQPKVDQPTKRPYTKRGGEINQRYLDEQKVARLFINKGYGLHVARKYLSENIQNNHYTNLITTIVREAWRKIEDYMSRFQQIKPMNTSQYKVIKTSLVQCTKWMDHTDLQTFYTFLKTAYNLDNRQPYKQQALRLYNACINRYQELRGQWETQSKVKTERKYVQKIKNSAIYQNTNKITNNSGNHQRKLPKVGPSDHQLGDIISLIKNQLKQSNNHPVSYNQPQRNQMPSHPQMMRFQPQNVNRNNFSQNPKNGPRR